jgi:hypothetical protein
VLSGGRYGVEAGDVQAPAKRTVALVGELAAVTLKAPPLGLEQYTAGMQ